MTNALSLKEKVISKSATFHKNCKVHIKFKKDSSRRWENGIIEEVGADYLILKFFTEEALKRWGCDSMVFFFIEISEIREFGDYPKEVKNESED